MKRKVAIVVGGRWHAFDLARELFRQGWLHRIVTTYPHGKTKKWGLPADKVVSLPASLLVDRVASRVSDTLRPRLQFAIHDWFGRAAAKHLDGADLVHCWSGFAEPSIAFARRAGIPVALERGSAHIVEQSKILTDEFGRLGLRFEKTNIKVVAQEIREYAQSDVVCVPSRFVEQSFVKHGFDARRLRVNPFGVQLDVFRPASVLPDRFVVCYAGALSVRKGIHYLVEAFLRADIPGAELVLIGDAVSETKLLLRNADKRVRLTGHVPQDRLAEIYRQASVFAIASVEEGLAMVQAQALACGLPLVCTSSTGGEDLLKFSGPGRATQTMVEYPAGFVVRPGDVDGLAEALRALASSRKLLEEKRAAACTIREAHLDWANYGLRAIAHYEDLLQHGGVRN